MKSRTIQLGGEILKPGDTVVVFTASGGRSERPITRIGTKRLYVDGYGTEVAFEIDTRKEVGYVAGYIPHFRTHKEVAAMDRRRDLVLKLREFGLQPVDGALGDLAQHSDEALEDVLAVLSKHRNSKN